MSNHINTREKHLSSMLMNRTAKYLSVAAKSYVSDAMPTGSTVVGEARSMYKDAAAAIGNANIVTKVRNLKRQVTFRNITNWYLKEEEEYDTPDVPDFSFDDGTESSIEIEPISEGMRASNQVSKAVVESSHQSVEAMIASTANIESAIDKQTAIVSSGFQKLSSSVDKLLEIMTKNTATLIEVTAEGNAANPENKKDRMGDMILDRRFSLENYKKIISSNVQGSALGPIVSMLPVLLNPSMWSAQTITDMGFSFALNKLFPKLKKNLQSVDRMASDAIISQLVRLGQKQSFGANGIISEIFGIHGDRKDASTSRGELALGAVPYDTISREALTSALPGYLREIVKLLGGPDMVYDYRTRSFRTQRTIEKEFHRAIPTIGALGGANKSISNHIDSTHFNNMMYDLMINDMGSRTQFGESHTKIQSFLNTPDVAKEYVRELLGNDATDRDKAAADRFAEQLVNALSSSDAATSDLENQIARNNVTRNRRAESTIESANKYNVDLSSTIDSVETDDRTIRELYGLTKAEEETDKAKQGNAGATGSGSHGSGGSGNIAGNPRSGAFATTSLSGVDYTNIALYEMYRVLIRGINVFRVGKKDDERDKPFGELENSVLKPPKGYQPKQMKGGKQSSRTSVSEKDSEHERGPNPLLDPPNDPDHPNEDNADTSTGKRVTRWVRTRGGALVHGFVHGSPEEIRAAFGDAFHDISEVGGGKAKGAISKLNQSYGNVTGHLKHKLTGAAYNYTDGNGEEVQIAKNEKGGLVGFVKDEFKGSIEKAKSSSSKWIKDIKSYFDYGDGDPKDKEDADVVSKRKKLIATSLGAFAGAGILGGPIALVAGGLAGSALVSNGVGKKINDALFGKDKDGKPTGLVSKAANAIMKPIEYQVGKTVAFAGAAAKKYVFGPMSDIGLAIKDRIATHVESAFKKIFSVITWPFRKVGGLLATGLKKVAGGLATAGSKLAKTLATTLPGKLVRGGIKAVGTLIGGAQTIAAKLIAGGNTFHKLKRGETYPLAVGQQYYDPTSDGDPKSRNFVHTLTEETGMNDASPKHRVQPLEELGGKLGVILNGDDPNEWRPRTKDYLKWRRKQRNRSIDDELTKSGYYGKGRGVFGRIRGFFGGDYKEWLKGDEERRKNRRGIDEYLEERRKTPEEIIAEQEELSRQQQEELAKEAAEISGDIKSGVDQITGEIIPGSSFKTHDQGIHDRLDTLIQIFGHQSGASFDTDGNVQEIPALPEPSSVVEPSGDEAYTNALTSAAASIISANGAVSDDEERIAGDILSEGTKDQSNKYRMESGIRELISIQQEEGAVAATVEEEKKSFLSSILETVGGMGAGLLSVVPGLLKFGAIAAVLLPLLQNGGIEDIADRISTSLDRFGDLFDPNLEESATKVGVDAATALADVQTDNIYTAVTPLGKLTHNQTDGAGNSIENSSATRARNAAYKWALTKDVMTPVWTEAPDGLGGNAPMNLNNTVSTVKQNLARAGTLQLASTVTGGLTNTIAKKIGLDDQSAQVASQVVSGGTAAGLLIQHGVTQIKNVARIATGQSTKSSVLDKLTTALSNVLKWIFDKLASSSLAKKIGGTKLVTGSTALIDKIVKGIQTHVTGPMSEQISAKMTEFGVKVGGTIGTAGLAIIAGAVVGILDGVCSTAYMFQVMPNDTDALMTTIAGVMRGVMGGAAMTPFGWVIAIIDILDGVLTAVSGLECGITALIAQTIYRNLGGDEDLNEKQEAFLAEKSYYESKTGEEMNMATFNDMVNSSGVIDRTWNGKSMIDEDGHFVTDDANKVLTEGGIRNLLFGNRSTYVKDAEGNVVYNDDGAVKAVDQYGNEIKENSKIGDSISIGLNALKRFIAGADIYATDENGQAILDSDGQFVVADHERSILGKAQDVLLAANDAATEYLEGVRQKAISMQESFLDAITNPLENARESLEDWQKKWSPWSSESGSDNADKIKSWIKTSIGGFWSNLKEAIGVVADTDMESTIPTTTAATKLSRTKQTSLLTRFWNRTGGPTEEEPYEDSPLSKSSVVTSGYGQRTMPNGKTEFHRGIDLTPADGSTSADVTAKFNGTVVAADDSIPNTHTGLDVKDHQSGNRLIYQTDDGNLVKNLHLRSGSIPSDLKKPGARVNAGQRIGSMGSTGRSNGPHLHYEVSRATPSRRMGGPDDETDTTSTLTSSTDGATGVTSFISQLTSIGNQMISILTGGLVDLDANSTLDTGSITSDPSAYVGYTGNITGASDFLALCEKEVGTTESPANSNKQKYGEWYKMNGVAWCMIFVQWCFNQAGLPLPYRTASCSALLNWYKENYPNLVFTSNPKPGDIVIFGFGSSSPCHTGIVYSYTSGDSFTTIEGNTSASTSGSQSNGGCVAKKTRKFTDVVAFIRAVDFEALAAAVKARSDLVASNGEDTASMWAYFKGLGYTDEAVAGILGCWTHESSHQAKRVEGDYLSGFPGYDAITDQSTMDNWTANRLGKAGKSAYMSNGHYYAGLGYAQWTGPRSKGLLDFAASKNRKWYDSGLQFMYMAQEMEGSYKGTKNKLMQATSAEDAADIFCRGYEGYNVQSGINDRKTSARSIYNQFKGTGGTTNIGGPETEVPEWEPSEKQKSIQQVQEEHQIGDPPNEVIPMGGPEESSITSESAASHTSTSSKRSNSSIVGSSSPASEPANIGGPEPIVSTPLVQSTDLSEILQALKLMTSYLATISGNTGSASSLLTSLNEKEFTTSIADMGSTKRHTSKSTTTSHFNPSSNATNTRMIASMITP